DGRHRAGAAPAHGDALRPARGHSCQAGYRGVRPRRAPGPRPPSLRGGGGAAMAGRRRGDARTGRRPAGCATGTCRRPYRTAAGGTAVTALLEMRAVTRVHGHGAREVTALRGVDLAVQPGEFVALMGPSGSGKSTLLHLAGGLALPTSGEVLVAGKSLTRLSPAERAVLRRDVLGYVFQERNLLPGLTALENVAFPLELAGLRTRPARAAALGALAEVGIEELASRMPAELSGGQ